MNNHHEGFFSFSVPPRSSPPAGGSGANLGGPPDGTAQNRTGGQAAGASSVSPDSTHPSVGPRGSVGDPFAFSVPPTTAGGDGSPDSSHGYASRPGTGATVKPRPMDGGGGSMHPPGPGPDYVHRPHRLSASGWGSTISTHNTRPMTAPGAGWAGGSFNHGYDYSSASAGLFGDGHTSSFSRPPVATDPTTTAWPPPSQALQQPLGLTAAAEDAYRGRNFSLPDFGSNPSVSPAGPASAYHPMSATAAAAAAAAAGYLRPSTHAGTSSLGFNTLESAARPSTASYPVYAARPMTAVSTGAGGGYEGGPSSMYAHPGHGMVPSVLAPPHMHTSSPSASALYPAMPTYPGSTPSSSLYGPDRFGLLQAQPRKRARRRYDEIERLYECNYPGCTKGYGTLNHLNAHITMQKHGPKRLPQEFKEIRKEWRARKKAESEARTALAKHGPASSSSLSVGLDMRPATATILPPSLPSSRPVTSHLSSSSPAYAMATVGGGMPLGGVASYYAPRPVTGGGGQLAVPPASAGAGQAGGYADAGAGTAYAGDFSYHRPASSAGLGGTPWSQAVDA